MDSSSNTSKGGNEQITIAKRLQLKWLLRMERLLDDGTVTSTDLATLARVLAANGWQLDESRLPKNLKDKLTKNVSFDDDLDDDARMVM